MPSGTTVFGMQQVLPEFNSNSVSFVIYLGGGVNLPPRRLGYYYVVLWDSGNPEDAAVTQTGLIFKPASWYNLVFPVDPYRDRLRLWVDWNEAGIGWFATPR
jgi:hypothetical protein